MPPQNLPPVDVQITLPEKFARTRDGVFVGHYFVFSRKADAVDLGSDRRSRLAMGPAPTEFSVAALTGEVVVAGATLRRTEQLKFAPIGCVVSDRDLYRAEDDVVNLFVALPANCAGATLHVDADGSLLTSRQLTLESGVALESLAMLLPGQYEARLEVDGTRVGEPARFTVAEYTLAPLSARLIAHELDRSADEIQFELCVESYQVPVEEAVVVELLDDDRPVGSTTVNPIEAGCFAGKLRLRGDGPFRLRVAPKSERGRTAEVVIPGTRAHERELTLLNELGMEKHFSLMPEPGAIPLRGGYVSDGASVATPLMVEEIETTLPQITVHADVRNLEALIVDQITGEHRVVALGDHAAGATIELDVDTALCMVILGCWVGERPFEGYTSFSRPTELDLQLDVPRAAEPGDEIVVAIEIAGPAETPVPVLVCIRDERLTATDSPEVALASTWKSVMDRVVSDMADSGLAALEDFEQAAGWRDLSGGPGLMTWDEIAASAMPASSGSMPPYVQYAAQTRGGFNPLRSLQASATTDFFERRSRVDEDTDDPSPSLAPRTDFVEMVYYGIVWVEGREQLVVPLGDATTNYVVEAFALAGTDWTQVREQLAVDQDVRVDLELPSSVHPDDDAVGWIRVATASGAARIVLLCDGEEVALGAGTGGVYDTPAELPFGARPGKWEARVEDPAGGGSDAIVRNVDSPGTFRHLVKGLRLLRPGESLDLDRADALTLRVLPGLDASFDSLVEASASYAHLCCEQTAAKMLSATFMYLTAEDDRARKRAENIIVSGAAREAKMLRRGEGFTMYPDSPMISEHYSRLAVRYLWNLERLAQIDVPPSLRRAVRDAIELADTAAQAHGMKRAPDDARTMDEAYAMASRGGDRERARRYVDAQLVSGRDGFSLKSAPHRVASRAGLAYAAATLVALGDLERALDIADQVTRDFNDQGRLYSTVDSIAAVVLMLELKAAAVADGSGKVLVNGTQRTTTEACALADQVETIEVIDGVAAVEVTRVIEESWDDYRGAFKVRVGFRTEGGGRARRFVPGHQYELSIKLEDGYKNGDLVHVTLPPSMAWLRGGGRVQTFSVDFEGREELTIPVIVTSGFKGTQHYAVCVRNMFEEERASSPGTLKLKNKSGWLW